MRRSDRRRAPGPDDPANDPAPRQHAAHPATTAPLAARPSALPATATPPAARTPRTATTAPPAARPTARAATAAAVVALAVSIAGCGSTPDPPLAPPERSEWFEGMNVTAYSTDGYGSDAKAALRRLREIETTDVAFTPTWYVSDGVDTSVAPDPERTPSDDGLRAAIRDAQAMGAGVMLKPHVDVLDGTFRGDVAPADPDAWWASYRAFVEHYADIAADMDVGLFVVGTELRSMTEDADRWNDLIADVRARFSGAVTYAANWDNYEDVPFWAALDYVGVDAYFPLADHVDADVDTLIAAWEDVIVGLRSFSEQAGRQILFTELGYPNQAGAAMHPNEIVDGDLPSDDAQSDAYAAAFRALDRQDWFAGIFWWDLRADGDAADADADAAGGTFSPVGRPAWDVLAAYQSTHLLGTGEAFRATEERRAATPN